jgi:hypothetical protein
MTKHRRGFLKGLAALGPAGAPLLAAARSEDVRSALFDVTRGGAVNDGSKLVTESVQRSIDACANNGGGTVYFPPGRYLTGTLRLKSHVTLHLEAGAVLAGSKLLRDYPAIVPKYKSYADIYTERSVIFAEGAENIAIHGRGIIDGQGAAFHGGEYKARPFLIRLIDCHDISIRDVTMRDAGMWALHLLSCDDVAIDGAAIHSRVNPNNDGIDVDCCRRVRISNTEISTIDDAIVLKSDRERICEDILVTNCSLSTNCSALKLGTESTGGFRNIVFSNCSIYDTNIAGIALLSVDGGVLERVAISNLAMRNVALPIFMRLGNRARPWREGLPRPGVGTLRDVRISNVEAVGGTARGCLVSGIPGHAMENITIEGVRLSFAGGGTAADRARKVPELPEAYPTSGNFGVMPAYGLFCRHARNLALRDVELRCEQPDQRPALIFDDVEGLTMAGASAQGNTEAGAPVIFRDVRDALVTGCRLSANVPSFVQLDGSRTANISLFANDLTRARKPVEFAAGVSENVLLMNANRL